MRRGAASGDPALYPGETPRIRALINQYADRHDVPRSLVHKVVQRESDYRPGARNGPYYGLMQILPETDVVARTQVVLVIGCSTSDLDT